jgi:glutamate synthase domain-containing protein 2
VGIATQQPHLRRRLKIEKGAEQLNRFFRASTELMQVMARACGHDHLDKFCIDDLTTFDREMAQLTGIAYVGVPPD